MKINEYLMLTEKANEVCSDIDRFIDGEEMKRYADTESLLEDAEDVIGKYRSLVYAIFNKVNVEDLFGK